MPRAAGECPFCGTEIPKTKATVCPGCGVGIPVDSLEYPITAFSISKEEEMEDSILAGFNRTLDPETPDDIIAAFNAAQLEGRHGAKSDKVAKRGDRRYVDAEDRAALAGTKAAIKATRAWDAIAAKARALVARQSFTLHEGGGYCWLKRWVNRTAELRWLNPFEPPRIPPVFGSTATLGGKPFIVPIRRKAELQEVLDEHNSGLRLTD